MNELSFAQEMLLTVVVLVFSALFLWGLFHLARKTKTKRKDTITDKSDPRN